MSPKNSLCGLRSESGFTLVEMALVAFLLGVMATIMFGVLNGFRRTGEAVEDSRQCERTARFLLTKLTREISSATNILLYIPKANKAQPTTGGIGYFEGKNDVQNSSDSDTMRFVAASGGQPIFGATQNSGPVEVRYFLAAPEDEDEKEIVAGRETSSLIREEFPTKPPDEKIRESRKIVFPLASRILGLNFRYLAEEKWTDEWTGPQSRTLPRAVEITLVLAQGDSGTARMFKTAVSITQRTGAR